MAKNNNLTDFLTDVANAIRSKKGTTDLINPQDFSAEIASIETGGGGGAAVVTANDVNFRDYDGTLLHSYTKSQFLALSELPELPSRIGLTCQGWNWTLNDAKAYVEEYGVLDIGATYITDDGKTRLYITIAAEGRMDVPISFKQSANGVSVDWGDGSEAETFGSTSVNASHHYGSIGDYVITLEVLKGSLNLVYSSSTSIIGPVQTNKSAYSAMLRKVEFGSGVTSIGKYAFNNCYSLSSVVIPNGVTSIGATAFYYCQSLSSVVIPNSVTSISDSAFYFCQLKLSVVIPNSVTKIGGGLFNNTFLSSVVIPNSVTSIGASAFYNCLILSSVVIPNSVTKIGDSAFYGCKSLSSVVISNNVTSIVGKAFYNCQSLSSVVIPNSVTSIGASAFYNCRHMAYYDFRQHTSVPTLSSTNAFSNIASDCKIVVPDALYDEWIAATNWSTYASNMIKASEFNG